jgi:hypothetical protein
VHLTTLVGPAFELLKAAGTTKPSFLLSEILFFHKWRLTCTTEMTDPALRILFKRLISLFRLYISLPSAF